jgi:hypothetical protein
MLLQAWRAESDATRFTDVIRANVHRPLLTTKGLTDRRHRDRTKGAEMGRQVSAALYALAMVAVIVGLDIAFFRNRIWQRLMVNVGIVLVFAAFYLRFFRHP